MRERPNIQEVKEGGGVVLISGSKNMTVTGIFRDDAGKVTHLECAWGDYFQNGDSIIRVHKFPVAALKTYVSLAEEMEILKSEMSE